SSCPRQPRRPSKRSKLSWSLSLCSSQALPSISCCTRGVRHSEWTPLFFDDADSPVARPHGDIRLVLEKFNQTARVCRGEHGRDREILHCGVQYQTAVVVAVELLYYSGQWRRFENQLAPRPGGDGRDIRLHGTRLLLQRQSQLLARGKRHPIREHFSF